ncbi:hypothetical protein [Rhizobium alvei]|uniref:Uncharacterized protein n=1 Tax=Rhizobium alvei TaxID=1132659 RepID=A0ABT8YH58_9HYPH|nr:hypothetical protein [Rhizobium alvei]MDO6963012.1 hypothetical protein [Rhizobium alvei]
MSKRMERTQDNSDYYSSEKEKLVSIVVQNRKERDEYERAVSQSLRWTDDGYLVSAK